MPGLLLSNAYKMQAPSPQPRGCIRRPGAERAHALARSACAWIDSSMSCHPHRHCLQIQAVHAYDSKHCLHRRIL